MSYTPVGQAFRVYLRTFAGQVSEKTITGDQGTAAAAFEALVNRVDLDGQKLAVALTHKNRQMAFHRFDRAPGDADYWRDKLEAIPWPPAAGPVGRPTEIKGGRRVQVYLDESSVKRAMHLGGGNVSEGIRLALSQATTTNTEAAATTEGRK